MTTRTDRLLERRAHQRHRRRLLVEWTAEGLVSPGFTHDVSAASMFICCSHIPATKMVVTLALEHPRGGKIRLRGVIVRVYRVSASLRQSVPNGFSVRLIEAPEDYFVLLSELMSLQLPAETH